MKEFSELGVKINRRFEGDRIKIEKIEGDDIVILDFEIKQSKLQKQNDPTWNQERGECLYLQITHNQQTRVLWGNYKFLIEQLAQIDKNMLPFRTRIVNEHGYLFK